METFQCPVFDLVKDEDDKLLVTTHEKVDGTMSIHVAEGYGGFTIHFRPEQALDLIGKLREATAKVKGLEVVKQHG